MLRLLILVTVIWFILVAIALADPIDEIMDSKGPTVVVYHATWCPACKKHVPNVEKVAKELGYKVILWDVDKYPALIKGVPITDVIVDGKSKRYTGYMSEEALKEALSL